MTKKSKSKQIDPPEFDVLEPGEGSTEEFREEVTAADRKHPPRPSLPESRQEELRAEIAAYNKKIMANALEAKEKGDKSGALKAERAKLYEYRHALDQMLREAGK